MGDCKKEMISVAKSALQYFKDNIKDLTYVTPVSEKIKIFGFCIDENVLKNWDLPEKYRGYNSLSVDVAYCVDSDTAEQLSSHSTPASKLSRCDATNGTSPDSVRKVLTSEINFKNIKKISGKFITWDIALKLFTNPGSDSCKSYQNASEDSGSVSSGNNESDDNGSDDNGSFYECAFELQLPAKLSDSQSD
jgi:hypothetical protein